MRWSILHTLIYPSTQAQEWLINVASIQSTGALTSVACSCDRVMKTSDRSWNFARYMVSLLQPSVWGFIQHCFIQHCAASRTLLASHHMHENISSCLDGHWCADCPFQAAASAAPKCVHMYCSSAEKYTKKRMILLLMPVSNVNKSLIEAAATT